ADRNPQLTLNASSTELLHAYQWSGNVRELENAIEYACVMNKGKVLLSESFPKPIAPDGDSMKLTFEASVQTLRAPKKTENKQAILYALAHCQDDRKKAAEYLKISRTTLWRRMKHYDIGKIN
ncbi:AAA family ATPase, partial [bacterium]|nr:AAA family ATPase [bacterium]